LNLHYRELSTENLITASHVSDLGQVVGTLADAGGGSREADTGTAVANVDELVGDKEMGPSKEQGSFKAETMVRLFSYWGGGLILPRALSPPILLSACLPYQMVGTREGGEVDVKDMARVEDCGAENLVCISSFLVAHLIPSVSRVSLNFFHFRVITLSGGWNGRRRAIFRQGGGCS
jgi:hypothetical protein